MNDPAHDNGIRKELASRWKTLTGATLAMAIGAASLPYYSFGLFITSLEAEFGWTRAQLSLGPTIFILVLMITSPILGILIDRWGARRILFPSLVAIALFFGALSRLQTSILMLYFLYGGMALIGCGSGTPVVTRIIAQTFDKARGTALGISLAGIGVAAALAPSFLLPIIENLGWRSGYLTMAATTVVLLPVVFLLLRSRPTREKDATGSAQITKIKDVLRDNVFWYMAVSFFLVAIASAGLIVHLVPLLTDRGMDSGQKAILASAVGVCIILARLSAGILIDNFFAPRVAASLMMLGAVAFLLFSLEEHPIFSILGSIGIGLSLGAEMDLIGYCISRYFGLEVYGRVFGILYATTMLGVALSPLLYGFVYDHAGSYQPILYASAFTLVLAAMLFLRMRKFD